MIKEFIERFEANKHVLRAKFEAHHPDGYEDIVRGVIECLQDSTAYEVPSPDRIHVINDGDYQGTLVYVIAAGGYQPSEYWYVKVGYGSCSGCDTLEGIREYSDAPPTVQQVGEYMTLATHVLQGLKRMGDDDQTGPY